MALAACAVPIVACGSSAKPRGAARPTVTKQLEFASCMRAHGVSNYLDPGAAGGSNIGSGVDPQSPAFQTAVRTCRKFQPGPRGGGEILDLAYAASDPGEVGKKLVQYPRFTVIPAAAPG
jgi:hypothetical protein